MEQPSALDRRQFLLRAAAASVAATLIPQELRAQAEIDDQVLERAEQLAGVNFTPEERDLMRESVGGHLENLRKIEALSIGNEVPPAFRFLPAGHVDQGLGETPKSHETLKASTDAEADLDFASVATLGAHLRAGRTSSVELTRHFLERLEHLNEQLHCVITFTPERAMAQAKQADDELARGKDRGPLHGIPWGVKDLFAVEGYRTTWGAAPFRDQMLATDAQIVRNLDAAGAVLVAKTAVGALAWGDVWFDQMTRNPWNLEQGSSGSSAGSASAVAAGALPFAIGTETLGSLVSPSTRCGVTTIRPTFGRVSRAGGMALSWTMDKVGPITRTVEDAAMVLDAIHGADAGDPDTVSVPLRWYEPKDLGPMRLGYVASAFDEERDQKGIDDDTLNVLRSAGLKLEPVTVPEFPVWDAMVILEVEAAAAFDELTRSNRDDELVRQVAQAWPNVFRAAQLVPAVQYVQAQRARTLLMQRYAEMFREFDAFVTPSFGANVLGATNLTGHPAVVVPNGFAADGGPTSISFIGGLYEEGKAAAMALAFQRATKWHRRHPEL